MSQTRLPEPFADRLAVSITEAHILLGVSRTTVRGLIQAGKLRTVAAGPGKRLIPMSAIAAFLELEETEHAAG